MRVLNFLHVVRNWLRFQNLIQTVFSVTQDSNKNIKMKNFSFFLFRSSELDFKLLVSYNFVFECKCGDWKIEQMRILISI
jgi:hypothetical protein